VALVPLKVRTGIAALTFQAAVAPFVLARPRPMAITNGRHEMSFSKRSKPRKAKAVAAFVVSTAILSFANSASADPLTWTMSARFNDSVGASATGTFTYDVDTNMYSDFNIHVEGSRTVPAFTYSSATSTIDGDPTFTEWIISTFF